MQLLLRSREREGLTWGVLISAAIHVVLIGIVVLAYRAGPERRSLVEEMVTYLVPVDRPQGQRGDKPMDWGGLGGKKEEVAAPGPAVAVRGTEPTIQPPSDSGAQGEPAPVPALAGDSILTEVQVDSAVRRYEESEGPQYPPTMLARNMEGRTLVTYVVDTTGLADTTSLQVVETTHPDFAEAVRKALPKMRFHPAILGGVKVRQLVQQSFGFRITRVDSTPPPRKKPPGSPSPVLMGGIHAPD